ncbi:hypothetical protein LTR17_018142 [Elasticomyces elasticus]|nr:hypothetical protein LTR17_018142 [Elasticomyces elasticus]
MRSGDDPEHSASTTGDHKLRSLIEQCRDNGPNVYHVEQYRDYNNYVDVLNNRVDDIVDNLTKLKLNININNELIQFRSGAGQSSPKHGVDPDNNYSTDRSRVSSSYLLCKQQCYHASGQQYFHQQRLRDNNAATPTDNQRGLPSGRRLYALSSWLTWWISGGGILICR